MNEIMLDIETLGANNNTVILSISAVKFNLSTGEIGDKFEMGLNILQQLFQKRDIENETIEWWSKQTDEAKKRITDLKQFNVYEVLTKFNIFAFKNVTHVKEIKIWGNGCTFDNIILESLYKSFSLDYPFPYWGNRDVRTLVDIADLDLKEFKFKGVKHNGLDDCLHQINYCHAAYKKLHKG